MGKDWQGVMSNMAAHHNNEIFKGRAALADRVVHDMEDLVSRCVEGLVQWKRGWYG